MVVERAGFTLIEILIVVGIITIMLASAVLSVASGRGAVKVKEATRGVMQMSRYASALSLLRQRPVVVTYHKKGRIEVRISGEVANSGETGAPSAPIYREVNGETTLTAEEIQAEHEAETQTEAEASPARSAKKAPASSANASSGGGRRKKTELFYTRRVLDPETLRQEDAEGEYEGVTFTVEVLGEDGEALPPELAALRTLKQPERVKTQEAAETEDEVDGDDEPPVSVTYEPNGSVNPYRVIVRTAGEDGDSEGFAIEISRSGKATVEDADDDRHKNRR